MNPKEKDDEIIELTDKELDEIFADDDFDNGEDGSEIRSFYFSNPDPYAKVEPRPDDAPKREFSFDGKGNIVVKNPSAYWLPDIKIVDEHSGTEYTVTGSYEGTETLDRRLKRIMEQNAADDETEKLRMQSEETMRLCKKRLTQTEKRIGELDRLFVRIYEDNVAGKLDDERFAMMSKNYTEEQKDLKAEVKGLQQQIHEQEQQAENIEQFVQRVKRNSTLTGLTPYALRELVKAVYVEAPDKSSGKRRQRVHIEYDLVGYIPVDELLKAEQA